MTDYENIITGDNFIIVPYNNISSTKTIGDDITIKIGIIYLFLYIFHIIYMYVINFDAYVLNLINYINPFSRKNNNNDNKVDNSPINKDDIEYSLNNYIETIKINQFLKNENETNLNKVINFYRYSTQLSTKLENIINDKYRYIFVNAELFYNYYGHDNKLIEVIECNDDNVVCVNLQKLYCEEQLLVGKELFNINNKEQYVPLRLNNLCFMTNYPKLNVTIWLIKTGLYDYLENNYV